MSSVISLVSSLLVLAAAEPSVRFAPAGSAQVGPAKPQDCSLEFFRTKSPERAYDEIGAVQVSSKPGAGTLDGFQELIRKKGCELGGDAVIVTRDFSAAEGAMIGTVVRYRSSAPAAAAPAADAPDAPDSEPSEGEEVPGKPCRTLHTIGNWSVCQIRDHALYVFSSSGETLVARFSRGESRHQQWQMCHQDKTWRIQSASCVREGALHCEPVDRTLMREPWDFSPEMATAAPAEMHRRQMRIDGVVLDLYRDQIQVTFRGRQKVLFGAGSPKITMSIPSWGQNPLP